MSLFDEYRHAIKKIVQEHASLDDYVKAKKIDLRLFSALAQCAAMVLAGLTARELGAGQADQA